MDQNKEQDLGEEQGVWEITADGANKQYQNSKENQKQLKKQISCTLVKYVKNHTIKKKAFVQVKYR